MSQRAMCLIKPDGMDHSSEITAYLKSIGVKLIRRSRVLLTIDDVRFLYPTLPSRPDIFHRTCDSMTLGEVEIIECEMESDIFSILKGAKTRLRALYAKTNPKGVVHTSEHCAEASRELERFFE